MAWAPTRMECGVTLLVFLWIGAQYQHVNTA